MGYKNAEKLRMIISLTGIFFLCTALVSAADERETEVQQFFSSMSLETMTLRRLSQVSYPEGITIDAGGEGSASFTNESDAVRFGSSSFSAAYNDRALGLSLTVDLSGKANYSTANVTLGSFTATEHLYVLSSDMVLIKARWNKYSASLGFIRERNEVVQYDNPEIISMMTDERNFSMLDTDVLKPVFRAGYDDVVFGNFAGNADGIEKAGFSIDLLNLGALMSSGSQKKKTSLTAGASFVDSGSLSGIILPTVELRGDAGNGMLRAQYALSADYWIVPSDVSLSAPGLIRADMLLTTGSGAGIGYFAGVRGEAYSESIIMGSPAGFDAGSLLFGGRVEVGFYMAPPYPLMMRFKVGYGINEYDFVSVSPSMKDASNFYFSLSLGGNFRASLGGMR